MSKYSHLSRKDKIHYVILWQSEGMTDAEMLEKLGYKWQSTLSRLRKHPFFISEVERVKHKLKSKVGQREYKITGAEKKRVTVLSKAGNNYLQIAKLTGISYWSIYHYAKQTLLPSCTIRKRLTDDEKSEMLRLNEIGLKDREIAEKLGRHTWTVQRYLKSILGYRNAPPGWFNVSKAWEKNSKKEIDNE